MEIGEATRDVDVDAGRHFLRMGKPSSHDLLVSKTI